MIIERIYTSSFMIGLEMALQILLMRADIHFLFHHITLLLMAFILLVMLLLKILNCIKLMHQIIRRPIQELLILILMIHLNLLTKVKKVLLLNWKEVLIIVYMKIKGLLESRVHYKMKLLLHIISLLIDLQVN